MISLTVTLTALDDTHATVTTEDGQELRVVKPENDTLFAGHRVGDALILTLTSDRDVLNSILMDSDDQKDQNSAQ